MRREADAVRFVKSCPKNCPAELGVSFRFVAQFRSSLARTLRRSSPTESPIAPLPGNVASVKYGCYVKSGRRTFEAVDEAHAFFYPGQVPFVQFVFPFSHVLNLLDHLQS